MLVQLVMVVSRIRENRGGADRIATVQVGCIQGKLETIFARMQSPLGALAFDPEVKVTAFRQDQ